MKKLTAVLAGSYKKVSKNGVLNTVFRYIVSGSPEALAAYKEAQGDNYRENDEKKPLFFTTRFAGQKCDLMIGTKGVIVDTSKIDQMSSLISQHPGALGDALAREAAKMLLGNNVAPVQEDIKEEKEA